MIRTVENLDSNLPDLFRMNLGWTSSGIPSPWNPAEKRHELAAVADPETEGIRSFIKSLNWS